MKELSLLQTINRPKNNPEQSEFSPSSKKEDASDIQDFIQPEILPTLSHTELFSLLKKSTSGDGVAYREEIMIPMIVEELWKRKEVTFFEKFSIIQELQEIATHYSVGDGYEPSEKGCIDALKTIALQEKNFFLQSTVALFSSETHHDYSLEERYDMIQGNWTELSPLFENGVTHLHTDARSYSVPGEILSASAVPEKIVREITGQWIHDENEWSTEHQEHDFLQKKHFTEKSLERMLPSGLLPEILPKSTPINDCYRFGRIGGDFFSSSISTEYGAFYDDLNLVALYPKSTARESSITLDDLNSIGRFLINLKQARPSDFMKATDSTEATLSNVPLPIQRNAFLLEKIQKYADIIMLHRDDFEYDSKLLDDASFLSLQFRGKELGSDYYKASRASTLQGYQVVISEDGDFDTIYNETLAWLQNEMAASATSSSPIKDIIRMELPDIKEGDIIHLSALYQSFSSTRMRVFLEDYFGFPYANIPLRAQLQFINYVHDKSKDEIQVTQNFIDQAETPLSRAHRFTVFLALEDNLPPETLYQVSKILPTPLADQVFAKYAEIVSAENSIEKLLSHKDGQDKSVSKKSTRDISKKLLQQGCELLTEIAKTKDIDESVILAKLEGLQVNIELLRTAFKTMKENGEDVSFEDFQDLDWQTALPPEQISEQNQWQMKKIYMENYSNSAYTPEFRSELLSGLDARFQNPDCRFYLLKHKDGRIIGFNAFHNTGADKEGHEHVYFGAFNISPQFLQSKLGETILDTTLGIEGNDRITDAHCDSRSPISDKYLRSGFVATGFESISGSPSFTITRDADLNKVLLTKRTVKTMTIDVLEKLSKDGSPREYIQVVKLQNNTFPTEYFKQGFILSHYRFGKNGVRYAVFEKPQSRKIGSKSNMKENPLLLAA